MSLFNTQIAYSKLGNVDPDELRSRRAQFLIYKGLQRADTTTRRRSWFGVKITKLKIKFSKRLKRLRKGVFGARVGLCKQIASVLKSCKYLIHGKQQQVVIRTLPPVF